MKGHLGKTGFVLAHHFWLQSTITGKLKQWELETPGYLTSTKTGMQAWWLLAWAQLSPFLTV